LQNIRLLLADPKVLAQFGPKLVPRAQNQNFGKRNEKKTSPGIYQGKSVPKFSQIQPFWIHTTHTLSDSSSTEVKKINAFWTFSQNIYDVKFQFDSMIFYFNKKVFTRLIIVISVFIRSLMIQKNPKKKERKEN